MPGREIRVGLEIHQMLDTRGKLFCSCPPVIRRDEPHAKFRRWLRLARSELGELDPAALFEYMKGRSFLYEAYMDTVCLVEMDEEPPHPLNSEALEIALTICLMLNCKVVDEVHVMRKIVIDGSNTTGFQRTALIGFDGYVEVNGRRIPINTVCLEEDAARKVGEGRREVVYRLDRLGIPLVEIATGPVISSPEEAGLVALRIGQLLRMTGRVKRGLGTIRQDLNVSVAGGARVEIKGVQELELIPKIVELEARRQEALLEIRDELRRRGVRSEDVAVKPVDVTDVFRDTNCRIAKRALRRGGVAVALRLPGFKGLLGREIQPGRRLGTEMAERARYWAEVGGIFHSDELPAYGISAEEVREVAEALGCGDQDAFVLVFEDRRKALRAIEAVAERAREAVMGVPEETRAANPDGTTRFMRPMPGKARMYPETDIRPLRITRELLERLREKLPEPPEAKYEKLVKVYGLSPEMARRILWSYRLDLFERLVEEVKAPPTLAASTLENTLVELRREGVPVHNLTDEHFLELFELVRRGELVKEAIPLVLRHLAENPSARARDAVKALGLTPMSAEEARAVVREVLNRMRRLVEERGEAAFGPVMGAVMRKLRGRVDGAVVSRLVREELRKMLESS
ncbi:MAG: Glu-tRNA(Gln) amidotransferase subunit GatE [Thermoproteales archaeon]|nr:Glu-tRNA(Gln) amidotransferase subunit GatE [Thermoproteales archaeon]